jgi:hypothetical protein
MEWQARKIEQSSETIETREKEMHKMEMEDRQAAEETRRATEFEWERLDQKRKRNFVKGRCLLYLAQQKLSAGDEFEAVSLFNEAYKYWPDGNEAMFILLQSQPEYLQKMIDSGQISPEHANASVLVVSKGHGIIPLSSMRELDKMLAAVFSQSEYLS